MRSSTIRFISALFAVVISQSAFANRWIIQNPSRVPNNAAAQDIQSVSSFELGNNRYLVVEDRSQKAFAATQALSLKALFAAESIEPDFAIGLATGETRQLATETDNAWHVTQLKYDEVQRRATGAGIIVAVLDTGVDSTHPALRSKMWVNAREIPGNHRDDDGNGYVDDVNGYNFSDKGADTSDSYGHGTHCSGIIASEKQANGNAQGIAPGVKIMAIKIIGDGEPSGFLSDAAMGIKYAVDHGAKVLSNSWRVYRSWGHYAPDEKNTTLLRDAIAYADSKGAIFVAAAGNESTNINNSPTSNPIFPVGYSGLHNLIGVAASTSTQEMASFSNFGDVYVHVAAPGDSILSTVPGGQWEFMSGTSMATPLTAGVLALGMSKGMNMDQAIASLVQTSSKLAPWNDKVTAKGIISPLDYLK